MTLTGRRTYKSIFMTCWVINLLLTLFVALVVIKAIVSPTVPPFYITCALASYIFLFIAATVCYVLFVTSERSGMAVTTVIFIIAEFLCVILTTISIFVSPRYDPFIMFSRSPIEWIQNHRWVVVVFAGLFLPVLVFQIFAINRYSAGLDDDEEDDDDEDKTISNAARRKATPYHSNKEVLTTLARF